MSTDAGRVASNTSALRSSGLLTKDFMEASGRSLAVAGVLLVAGAAVEGLGLLLLIPLLAVLTGDAATGAMGGISTFLTRATGSLGAGGQIGVLAGFALLLLCVRGAIILKRDEVLTRLQVNFIAMRRMAVIRNLASASWEAVARLRHARVTHVLGEDVQQVGAATSMLLQIAVLATILALQVVLAIALSWALALFVGVLGAVAFVAMRPLLRVSRNVGTDLAETHFLLLDRTTQYLSGLKLAMGHGLQQRYVEQFEEKVRNASDRRVQFARLSTATGVAMSIGGGAAAAAVIIAGAGPLALPAPVLLAFLFILSRMGGAATALQFALQRVAHALPAYEQLRKLETELSAFENLHPPPSASAPARRPQGEILLEGVSFDHDAGGGRTRGIHNVDLRIDNGEAIGIAGPSGSGKTTLADLITGLYPPRVGRISIDGAELVGDVLAGWRRSISYVPQDGHLFHDTIRENLLWAVEDATDQELWQALDLSTAGDLVRGMSGGLDTIVGERGNLVSGGERQRIVLARALLRRPRLLLLDEATSAVEPSQERLIIRNVRQSLPDTAVLMIAHREESLRLCDRVLRMQGGTFVAGSSGQGSGG